MNKEDYIFKCKTCKSNSVYIDSNSAGNIYECVECGRRIITSPFYGKSEPQREYGHEWLVKEKRVKKCGNCGKPATRTFERNIYEYRNEGTGAGPHYVEHKTSVVTAYVCDDCNYF